MKTLFPKLSISIDSFLFSVKQASDARQKNTPQFFNSHLRFEPFLEKTWTMPGTPSISGFKKTMESIFVHHYNILPNYRRQEDINLENISWFSHSIAALFADVEYLLLEFTGSGYPLLSEPKIARAPQNHALELAIHKYSQHKASAVDDNFLLFPLLNEEGKPCDNDFTQQLWSLFSYLLQKNFGDYSLIILDYALWRYATPVKKEESLDWRLYPPCGAVYRKQFSHLFERDFNKNRNGSFSKGERDKTNKNSNSVQVPSPENSQANVPKKSYDNSKGKFKNDNKFNNNDDEGRLRYEKKMELLTQAALEEVSSAVDQLNQNSSLHEVALAPQNSFLRRKQHEAISAAGFETESRGEEALRHVCVIRK